MPFRSAHFDSLPGSREISGLGVLVTYEGSEDDGGSQCLNSEVDKTSFIREEDDWSKWRVMSSPDGDEDGA